MTKQKRRRQESRRAWLNSHVHFAKGFYKTRTGLHAKLRGRRVTVCSVTGRTDLKFGFIE